MNGSAAPQTQIAPIRRIAAIASAVLAVPLVMLGIFDPLEGGIALLSSAVPLLAARLLSRVPFPVLLSLPYGIANTTESS